MFLKVSLLIVRCSSCNNSVEPKNIGIGRRWIHLLLCLLTAGAWFLIWILIFSVSLRLRCPICRFDLVKDYEQELSHRPRFVCANEWSFKEKFGFVLICLSIQSLIFLLIFFLPGN